MKLNHRRLIFFFLIMFIVTSLTTIKLPYYVYKPGSADPLTEMVTIDDSYPSEGTIYLVTVSGGQATPLQYIWAKIAPYQDLIPIDKIRPKDLSNEEYFEMQLQMMKNSQEASMIVAYEAAGKKVRFESKGLYVVSIEEGMPADGKLEQGDLIVGIDSQTVENVEDLTGYLAEKEAGDRVQIVLERKDSTEEVEIELDTFTDDANNERIGIGVRLMESRNVIVDPEVKISSGRIGGPSAGIMFALEIYNQLTEEDITKGYQIIGTGEIDEKGRVYRIGEVDKKVIAADREEGDIFFVPYENGAPNSNYEVAKKTAEKIGTDMEIVPIDTFYDALQYLENLEPKQ